MGGGVDPDLTGFAAAQQRLREKLGRIVTFYSPAPLVWPGDLPAGALDPETGRPFDPTIKPLASGWVTASALANTVYAPLQTVRRDAEQADQLGVRSRLNKDLILDIGDAWTASAATMYELDGEFWQIVDTRRDGVGSAQRLIVYGQTRSGDLSDIQADPTSGSDHNL